MYLIQKIAEPILGYGVVAVVFTPRHACGSTPGFDLINIRIYQKEDDRNLSKSIQRRNTAEAQIQIYGDFFSNQYLKKISPPSEPGHTLVLNILIVNCPLKKNSKNVKWHLYG